MRLHQAAPLELPTDRPRPAIMSADGDWCEVRLGLPLSAQVREFAKKTGATPFMVLLACYVALLRRMSGQDDLTVGTAIAHRLHPETFGLVSDFINMLSLPVRLCGDPTSASLLAFR